MRTRESGLTQELVDRDNINLGTLKWAVSKSIGGKQSQNDPGPSNPLLEAVIQITISATPLTSSSDTFAHGRVIFTAMR